MSTPNIEMEVFDESFDNWLRDSDDDAAGDLDGDDMAPAVVRDTDDSDTEISDDDYDDGAETIWINDAQRGRVSFWQYNGTKRHRFGNKLFKLCSRAGYTQKVKVYAGKDSKPQPVWQKL
nr:piggyBac transposable element-derived protein [Haemonchus contortus]